MPLILVIAVVLGVILLLAWQANILFVIRVREGRCEVTRGHVPGVQLGRIKDVVRLSRIREARIVARRGADGVSMSISPRSEGAEQRLRNVVGSHPMGAFRAAPESPVTKWLKRLFGVALMSWLISRFMR